MEQLVLYIEAYMVWIIMALAIIQLLLIITVFSQRSALKKLKKGQKDLFKGMDGSNLEEILNYHLNNSEQTVEKMLMIEKENKELSSMLTNCVQKVGLVRFSAFDNIGSDLSFSAALLDAQGNGLVISSLYGREESRAYAKPVENFASEYQLSEEEEKAISIAQK